MSLRGLAVLLVLLISIVSVAVWIDRPPNDASTKQDDLGVLLPPPEGDVRRVEIDRASGPLALERRGDAWSIVRPSTAEADPRRVEELLRSLREARVVSVVDEKGADEKSFGLAPPEIEVRIFAKRERPEVLRIGRKSPVGFERYATLGAGRVVLADASLASALEKAPDELEERRLLPVDVEKIRRIRLERPEGVLSLSKEGSEWRLVEPIRDAADASAVDGLARSLTSLAVSRRDEAPAALPPKAPAIRIEIETTAGAVRRAEIATGKGEPFGRRADGSLFGTVEEGALKDLGKSADDLRDRRVAILPPEGIREVRIETGGKTLRATREKDDAPWKVQEGSGAPTPADPRKVDSFLDRLRWARAEGFEEGASGAPESVVVVMGATGEIGRIEIRPAAASGAAAAGEGALAVRSTFRPGVVLKVEGEALSPLPKAATDLTLDSEKREPAP